MYTDRELSIIEDALSELMADAYGHDNAEGCYTPEHWAEMTALADKVSLHRLIGRKVRYTKNGREYTGVVRDVRYLGHLEPSVLIVEIPGGGSRAVPRTQITRILQED